MKNILVVSALLLLLASPVAAFASTVTRTGDTISVAENQTVKGNLYAVGGSVALSGDVDGDAIIFGASVTAKGKVSDDLFIMGGSVNMNASVTQDVRIVAGDVTISGVVQGDVVVIGGRLTILSSAKITGDVLLYGEEATIDGAVGGQVLGTIRTLRLNGPVGKGVDITTNQLTLGDHAAVTGDVLYISQNELIRGPGAIITGKATLGTPLTTAAEESAASWRQLAIIFLMSLFATLCVYLMARRFVEKTAEATVNHFGLSSLVGFAALALAPVTIGILFVSMLGILIGAVGLVLIVALAVIALTLMNAVAGALLAKLITKKVQLTIPYIIGGAVALQLCLLVPFIGILVFAGLFLATLGALVLQLYRHLIVR